MSQSLPWDLELSHQGSSDKLHKKEPPFAMKARWEAVQMSGQSPLAFDKSYGKGKVFTVNGKEVLPLKYIGERDGTHQEVALVLEFPAQVDPNKLKTWTIEVTINDTLGDKSCTYTNADGNMYIKLVKGVVVLQFWVNELLQRLEGEVNLNLLAAEITLSAHRVDNGNEVSSTARTAVSLHVLLQKLIVLLPGVMASSLWVDDIKCYPGLVNVAEKLRRLGCSEQGVPAKEAEQICFVTPGNPYTTDKWVELLNKGLPKLKVLVSQNIFGSKYNEVPYYAIQGYPYDWRVKASVIIEALFGAEASVPKDYVESTFKGEPHFYVKLGVKPLSLRTILKYWSINHPFLHDKASLMGHSTGAAIMNAIVRDDRAAAIVDKAFFVAAPFFGALKAYNAFLCGTMNLGMAESFVLEQNEMLKLGKNLPVLYFLMPNASFPYPVVEITAQDNAQKDYYRVDAAADAMDAILDFATVHNITSLTENAVKWNATLAGVAAEFSRSCQQSALTIGEDNCVVYWSTMGPQSTIGTILYDARNNYVGDAKKRISYRMTGGDATVPAESLRGSFPEKCLFKVTEEGCLDHVTIITAKTLWEKTAKTLGAVVPPKS